MRRDVTAGVFAVALLLFSAVGLLAKQARPAQLVSPAPEVNPHAVVWRTPKPPTQPQAGDVWINPKDGMQMIYIAPGLFTLGTTDEQARAWMGQQLDQIRAKAAEPMGEEQGRALLDQTLQVGDEGWQFVIQEPQVRMKLPGYWMARTEVTNAQYEQFLRETEHPRRLGWDWSRVPPAVKNHPVVIVTWDDARAYCQWAGGQLPTEVQWEKAARGPEGKLFPWGNQWDAQRCRNGEAPPPGAHSADTARALRGWPNGPAEVASYPGDRSPYGCMDMAGNVSEWCEEWLDFHAYQRYALGDFSRPKSGRARALRGGNWKTTNPSRFLSAFRGSAFPVAAEPTMGFRYAR